MPRSAKNNLTTVRNADAVVFPRLFPPRFRMLQREAPFVLMWVLAQRSRFESRDVKDEGCWKRNPR